MIAQERGLFGWLYRKDWWFVSGWAAKFSCWFYGHLSDRDMCGLPEHDYCVWCMKDMPYAAATPKGDEVCTHTWKRYALTTKDVEVCIKCGYSDDPNYNVSGSGDRAS